MKKMLISLLLTIALWSLAQAQNARYTLSFKDLTLQQSLDTISGATGYFFSYNSELIENESRYTLKIENTSFDSLLQKLLVGTGLEYKIIEDQVILNRSRSSAEDRMIVIYGTVRDRQSGEPIPGANVFFDETSLGTSTDISGNFRLEAKKSSGKLLIISFVGYKKKSINLGPYIEPVINLDIELESELYELNTITIFADSSKRGTVQQVVYSKFERALLGLSPFADQCEIQNPQVLTLYYDESLTYFEAKNSEPLRIINWALGYEISYDIDFFEIIGGNTKAHAMLEFKELVPGSGRQRRDWRRNRREAYRGSQRHFLKSLIYKADRQEGYRMYAFDSSKIDTEHPFKRLSRKDILRYTSIPYIFSVQYSGYIYVSYRKEAARKDVKQILMSDSTAQAATHLDRFYTSDKVSETAQKSAFRIINDRITIDINGHNLQPSSIATFGYWSAVGLAELVPIDYKD